MNFASRGEVTITLTNNDVGGPLDIVGGMARPDAVDHATTTINSEGNHYSAPQTGSDTGWQITGGSTPPPLLPASANADSNTASANSTDDQIEKVSGWDHGDRWPTTQHQPRHLLKEHG
jgi:hypothetical protein